MKILIGFTLLAVCVALPAKAPVGFSFPGRPKEDELSKRNTLIWSAFAEPPAPEDSEESLQQSPFILSNPRHKLVPPVKLGVGRFGFHGAQKEHKAPVPNDVKEASESSSSEEAVAEEQDEASENEQEAEAPSEQAEVSDDEQGAAPSEPEKASDGEQEVAAPSEQKEASDGEQEVAAPSEQEEAPSGDQEAAAPSENNDNDDVSATDDDQAPDESSNEENKEDKASPSPNEGKFALPRQYLFPKSKRLLKPRGPIRREIDSPFSTEENENPFVLPDLGFRLEQKALGSKADPKFGSKRKIHKRIRKIQKS